MRDSINYNLNYFIMRMSGTKPIKNTMRKSPIKQEMANSPMGLKQNTDIASANNRRGLAVRGKKVSSYVAMDKKAEVKSNKPKSAETIAKNEASKKAMDKYIKITKSKQALKTVKK